MPPLLALAAAALASVPALALSFLLISGHQFSSLAQAWAGFTAVAGTLLPIYAGGAFVYGAILWVVLRALGLLSLPALLVGSVIPVFAIVFAHVAVRGGAAPGLHIVLIAFSLPCLLMAFVLWLFAIKWPIGT